jgi:hypothetical protein
MYKIFGYVLLPYIQIIFIFIFSIFCNLVKKKGLMNATKGFFFKYTKIHHILREKI